MPRVIHFELTAQDPERAVQFYEQVFGWKTQKWQGTVDYWLLTTGEPDHPGIDGGLMRAEDAKGMPPVTNTIDVPDLDAYTEKIASCGGSIVQPRMTVPGVGYMAYCRDTEGNMFGVMQMDDNAK